MNPAKCSTTITKLVELAAGLQQEGLADWVNVAAISYDPAFDTPERLRAYGRDRGLIFDDRVRLLRATESTNALRSVLDLSVGFGVTTVNQHGRDMFVFDAAMRMRSDHARTDWTPSDIIGELKAIVAS